MTWEGTIYADEATDGGYGRHSLFNRDNIHRVDVRDLIEEHYTGRHRNN